MAAYVKYETSGRDYLEFKTKKEAQEFCKQYPKEATLLKGKPVFLVVRYEGSIVIGGERYKTI